MSSLFKGKYKFYFPSKNNNGFSIYLKERGNFNFFGSDNSIKQFPQNNNVRFNSRQEDKFPQNIIDGETYYTFAIFNIKPNNILIKMETYINKKKYIIFEGVNPQPGPDGNQIDERKNLNFVEGKNIFFLKFNKKIKEFQFKENESSDDNNYFNVMEKLFDNEKNTTKEEIFEMAQQIMFGLDKGETYEYNGKDFNLLIYPYNSDSIANKTHIQILECENALREYHHLPNESIISFFQMEIKNNNERSLVNQVEYQVFDENNNMELNQIQI